MLPSTSQRYRNTADAVVKIYRSEGIGAFYKGILPSLMGVSHVAVQFPLYEQLKMMASKWSLTLPLRASSLGDPTSGDDPLPPSSILLCSALSKMVATLATYPHEVLRTRLQIRKHEKARPDSEASKPRSFTWARRPDGVIDTFLLIKRQDGWKGFYRGLSINLVRTVPNSAVTMLTYVSRMYCALANLQLRAHHARALQLDQAQRNSIAYRLYKLLQCHSMYL